MSSTRLFVILVLSMFLLQSLYEVEARGARGGSRGGGSRRISSNRNTRRISSRRSSTKRVSPNTPLRVTSYRSNILKSQVKNPSYSKPFRQRFIVGAVVGALIYTHAYSAGRTYNTRYNPYHSSHVFIPRLRALRLQEESYTLETENGDKCRFGNLTENYENTVLNVTTKVSYTSQHSPVKVSNSTMTTVILSDVTDGVLLETRTLYNKSVIRNGTGLEKNCSVMLMKVRGYLVVMYDKNPNSKACCNAYHFAIIICSFFVYTYFNY